MLTAQRLQRRNCLPEEVSRHCRTGSKVSVLSAYRNICVLQSDKEDVIPNRGTSRDDRICSFPKWERITTTGFVRSPKK
jgi:hypothetical protein